MCECLFIIEQCQMVAACMPLFNLGGKYSRTFFNFSEILRKYFG